MKPAIVILALVLSGCTGAYKLTRLPPALSTEADVVAAAGQPTRRWTDPDGGHTLEYSYQPAGYQCLMVRLDQDGRLVSVEDALGERGLLRVQIGMSREQVRRLLGQERTIVHFALSGEEVWDWNVDNRYGRGWARRFNVHFLDGRVARTSETIEEFGDNDNGNRM